MINEYLFYPKETWKMSQVYHMDSFYNWHILHAPFMAISIQGKLGNVTQTYSFFLLSLKRWAKLNQKIRLDLQPLHVQMLTLVLESYITWTQMWVSMHQTLYVQFFFLMYLDFGGFLEGYIPHTYVGHRNFKKNEKSKQHS